MKTLRNYLRSALTILKEYFIFIKASFSKGVDCVFQRVGSELLIYEIYVGALAGHFGVDNTYSILMNHYY